MDNAWPDPAARSRFLQCAQWGADHHFNLRGHPVFYPAWQFSPASLASLKQDQPALRKAVLDHIVDVMEQTRQFNFTEYDVTNELRWLGGGGDGITGTLGGRPAVAEWFKVAREHAPASARLGINENTNLEWGGLTNDAQNNYFGWIQYLMDQGVGPDVIGLQAHFDTATGPEAMLQILDRFAAFGKPIQITEFDFLNPDEQSQGKFTRDFLTAVFSHPATDAITAWGFWEGRMWRPGAALVRKDWSLKPSGQAWMDLVRTQWWTDVNSATGADGICATRGFLGDYKITVDAGGKQAFTEVKLDKQGATAVFVVE